MLAADCRRDIPGVQVVCNIPIIELVADLAGQVAHVQIGCDIRVIEPIKDVAGQVVHVQGGHGLLGNMVIVEFRGQRQVHLDLLSHVRRQLASQLLKQFCRFQ